MALVTTAVADTTIFIAQETGRTLATARLPEVLAVSVVTVAELRVGVLVADDDLARARRLKTLERAIELSPIPIDDNVATAWAGLRVILRRLQRTVPVNDTWIAATALSLGLPVVTQDSDYDGIPGLEVISV